MANTTDNALQALTDHADPNQWKDWLSHIQNNLISQGYCQGLTDEGSAEFAGNFAALQEFFSLLRDTQ